MVHRGTHVVAYPEGRTGVNRGVGGPRCDPGTLKPSVELPKRRVGRVKLFVQEKFFETSNTSAISVLGSKFLFPWTPAKGFRPSVEHWDDGGQTGTCKTHVGLDLACLVGTGTNGRSVRGR